MQGHGYLSKNLNCFTCAFSNLQMVFFPFLHNKSVYSEKMRNFSSFKGLCVPDLHWVFNLSNLVHLWDILHYPLYWGDSWHKLEPPSNKVFMLSMLSNFDIRLVTVVSTLSLWNNHPDTERIHIFHIFILEIGWPFLIC